jgi:hypothetical protein
MTRKQFGKEQKFGGKSRDQSVYVMRTYQRNAENKSSKDEMQGEEPLAPFSEKIMLIVDEDITTTCKY